MSDTSPSFIRQLPGGRFRVDPQRVTPESVFTTELLLQAIVQHRNLARGRMLDVGCGTKPYRSVFADRVNEHWGVDVPHTMHGLRAIDAFAPSHALPYANGSFDFVLCTEVLEHVPHPDAAWKEIGRVLKPGGVALVTTPFMYRFHEMPHDYWRITPPAHRLMAQSAGLEVEAVHGRGGYLSVLVDLKLKGLAFVVRGIRKLLGRPSQPGKTTRFLFGLLQRPIYALLSRENLKSDEFTIGLLVIARKPVV